MVSIETSQQPSSIGGIKFFSWSLPFFENRVKFTLSLKKGRDQLKIFIALIDVGCPDVSIYTVDRWSYDPPKGSKDGLKTQNQHCTCKGQTDFKSFVEAKSLTIFWNDIIVLPHRTARMNLGCQWNAQDWSRVPGE